jgi:hypothetical protein
MHGSNVYTVYIRITLKCRQHVYQNQGLRQLLLFYTFSENFCTQIIDTDAQACYYHWHWWVK